MIYFLTHSNLRVDNCNGAKGSKRKIILGMFLLFGYLSDKNTVSNYGPERLPETFMAFSTLLVHIKYPHLDDFFLIKWSSAF